MTCLAIRITNYKLQITKRNFFTLEGLYFLNSIYLDFLVNIDSNSVLSMAYCLLTWSPFGIDIELATISSYQSFWTL